jgi:hypothetical protein
LLEIDVEASFFFASDNAGQKRLMLLTSKVMTGKQGSTDGDTLSLCTSLNVRDQVSHPYKTTGKIKVFYILIFTFLDSRREDKRFWTEW